MIWSRRTRNSWAETLNSNFAHIFRTTKMSTTFFSNELHSAPVLLLELQESAFQVSPLEVSNVKYLQSAKSLDSRVKTGRKRKPSTWFPQAHCRRENKSITKCKKKKTMLRRYIFNKSELNLQKKIDRYFLQYTVNSNTFCSSTSSSVHLRIETERRQQLSP